MCAGQVNWPLARRITLYTHETGPGYACGRARREDSGYIKVKVYPCTTSPYANLALKRLQNKNNFKRHCLLGVSFSFSISRFFRRVISQYSSFALKFCSQGPKKILTQRQKKCVQWRAIVSLCYHFEGRYDRESRALTEKIRPS